MSETHPHQPAGPASHPKYPADLLINLIVTLLTPMFFSVAGGDLNFARLAATEALDAYCAETHADLLSAAKILAFGLATLASLSHSMADDLSVTQILRLRASANATDRAEHRNRLALERGRPRHADIAPPEPEPVIDHAALAAAAADMQQRTAEHLARLSPATLSPAPAPVVPQDAKHVVPQDAKHVVPQGAKHAVAQDERHYHATWAASAATVAAETAASLPSLPPEERKSAAIWINVLNDAAKSFMAGDVPPRPRPGDLAAAIRGT